MKLIYAVAVALPMAAHAGEPAGMGTMDMSMMKQHMAQMREHFAALKSARTAAERESLMAEHMKMMDDHMAMMTHMMGPGPGHAAAKGAAQPSRPAGVSEEEHKSHHPGGK